MIRFMCWLTRHALTEVMQSQPCCDEPSHHVMRPVGRRCRCGKRETIIDITGREVQLSP